MESEKVTVVVSTVNNDETLLDKMNLSSDAIVINQTCLFEKKFIQYKGNEIIWYNFDERGVGLSRNNGISRVKSKYCALADEDVTFINNYSEKIKYWFSKLPKADVLIFNFKNSDSNMRSNDKIIKVGKLNYYNYGAPRIVFRTSTIKMNGIFFNQSFGGGTTFYSGEDTLFLAQILRLKLNVYAVPDYLCEIDNLHQSSWFEGYNEKFFFDKGVLISLTNPSFSKLFCLLLLLKNYRKFKTTLKFNKCVKLAFKGVDFYKKRVYLRCDLNEKNYYSN